MSNDISPGPVIMESQNKCHDDSVCRLQQERIRTPLNVIFLNLYYTKKEFVYLMKQCKFDLNHMAIKVYKIIICKESQGHLLALSVLYTNTQTSKITIKQ